MGDPKFSRRKYNTPSHPWQGERIAAENEMVRKYGLKNKTELWKVNSVLKIFRQRARDLQAKIRYGDTQAEKERDELIQRLDSLGIISKEATLDDILSLDIEILLARRLQTMAYLKGFSNSAKQARQFIVHGHISLNGRKVTIPGYVVKRSEEETLAYLSHSPLADDLHPARPKDELSADSQPKPMASEEPVGASAGIDPSKGEPAQPPAQPAAEGKKAEQPTEDKKAEGPVEAKKEA
ncbi:MAG: 30S ribosomal protein S4 [Thermoplasmata archaeon]